jgi:hypothetical protein
MTFLEEFILFDFPAWFKYGDTILRYCSYSVFPIFIFSLIYDKSSNNPNPTTLLKRILIVQFLLVLIPAYYKPVAGFGIKVGNTILKEQKTGLISNWYKFKKRASKNLKKEETGVIDTVSQFFKFSGTDFVEKASAILIFVCMLLIKIIYSVVYYLTYCTSGILAVLSIFPFLSNHLLGVAKSILYLIVTAILIALILSFMNQVLDFQVSRDGYIKGLSGIAQFIVLCFVLLGTLKIGHSLVNGSGAETWAGNMGNLLGAGLAFKVMGHGKDLVKWAGANTTKNSAKGAWWLAKESAYGITKLGAGAVSSSAYIASRPPASAFNGAKSHIQSSIMNKASNISRSKFGNKNNSLDSYTGISSPSQEIRKTPFLKNRYENSFNQVSQNEGSLIKKALNPANHLRASGIATVGLSKEVFNRMKQRMGLPKNSEKLTFKEKSVFVAQKAINGGLQVNKNPQLNNEDLIKGQVMANRISKRMEKK